MISLLIQVLIFGLTGGGLWLVGFNDRKSQRLGFLLCTLAQPLWVFETFVNKQWGMLLLSVFMFISFARGWWKRRV